ncbi:MAG: response regulator [Acidobacteriia bacterium]|nr:response regulator [Terriglobia bacterium]
MSTPEQSVRTVLCIGNEPVHLNLRCSFLKEHGWNVLSSGSGREGLLRFSTQAVDSVILDLDDAGVEGALVAGELKRIRPSVHIVMLVTNRKALVDGALDSADTVLLRSDESVRLLDALRPLPQS